MAQPSLRAARYVIINDYDLHAAVSFTLHHDDDVQTVKPVVCEHIRLVESTVLFFAVCRPKFTKFSMRAQEILQFVTLFPLQYLVNCRDIL